MLQFLTKYEIVFKTITTALLSSAAIIISGLQYCTASKQLELAKFQKLTTQANSLPIFDIKNKQTFNEESGKFDDTSIIITNTNSSAKEFSSRAMFFLKISAYKNKKIKIGNSEMNSQQEAKLILPLLGVYPMTITRGTSRGELQEISGYRNVQKKLKMQNILREKAKNENFEMINFDEISVLRVDYKDIIGEWHTEYYRVPAVGLSTQIENESASEFEKFWSINPKKDLDDINYDKLIDELNESLR